MEGICVPVQKNHRDGRRVPVIGAGEKCIKSVRERNIIKRIPKVTLETETDQVSLKGENGLFHLNDVCLELREYEKQMQVYLRAETTAVCV